jgi:hypothetical protein
VRLKELTVTITDPANKTFKINSSLYFNRCYEIELAYKDDINSTSNTLTLTPTGEKLDKYIKASSFKLRTEAVIKETLTTDITVKADMKFRELILLVRKKHLLFFYKCKFRFNTVSKLFQRSDNNIFPSLS